MALCSGQGSMMTSGAVQQGLQAFLTSGLPAVSPGAPDLTPKALCWVRQLPSLHSFVSKAPLLSNQAATLIALIALLPCNMQGMHGCNPPPCLFAA